MKKISLRQQRYFRETSVVPILKYNKIMIQKYSIQTGNRQNKRKLASKEEAILDLKKQLPLMFQAFREAYKLYEMEIVHTPPEARARGFEAALLNCKMIQSIQKHFPLNWRFGKYSRFTLRTNGYIVLFKKFGKNNRPMNIRTKSVEAISQQLSLPLFNDSNSVEEPILFFGYKRDEFGKFTEAKLLYIDEQQVKWTISSQDFEVEKSINLPSATERATPTLRIKDEENKKLG